MSVAIRPTLFIRPPVGILLRAVPNRAFHVATRVQVEAGKPHHASTALKTHVRESEERSSASVQVVGDEVKGAEGKHYQGAPYDIKLPSKILIIWTDQTTSITTNFLTDMSRTGAWTLFNPIYTDTAGLFLCIAQYTAEASRNWPLSKSFIDQQ